MQDTVKALFEFITGYHPDEYNSPDTEYLDDVKAPFVLERLETLVIAQAMNMDDVENIVVRHKL